jgi:hypothetical protein
MGARIGDVFNALRILALKYHLRSTSAHALPARQAVPSVGRKLISISLIVGARMTLLQPVLFAALNATDRDGKPSGRKPAAPNPIDPVVTTAWPGNDLAGIHDRWRGIVRNESV